MDVPIPNASINLAPERSFEEQHWRDKLFSWLVGVGRLLIIITELTAVVVWVSRFSLDYQITTLQENIEEQAMIVQASKKTEASFRQYQEKLSIVSDLESQKLSASTSFEFISSRLPRSILLSQMSMTADNLTLKAQTPSVIDFFILVDGLIKDQYIKELILENTSYDKSRNVYEFSLTLKLAEVKKQ